jgi:hypothetical protein
LKIRESLSERLSNIRSIFGSLTQGQAHSVGPGGVPLPFGRYYIEFPGSRKLLIIPQTFFHFQGAV